MYSITTTKAIVLKSFDSGEKDATISLFTKDLGQIYAKVSGVRDLNSKHRYALQEHSLIDVSLVSGKTGWKITSSNFIKSFYFDLDNEKREEKREKILQILSLVRRFYIGAEADEEIFDNLIFGFEKLITDSENLENIEAEIVFNFLNSLGYIEESVEHRVQSVEDLKKIRKAINEGIKISGL